MSDTPDEPAGNGPTQPPIDPPEPPGPPSFDPLRGELLPVVLEDEMRRSYLDYAMSVIVSRDSV